MLFGLVFKSFFFLKKKIIKIIEAQPKVFFFFFAKFGKLLNWGHGHKNVRRT